MLIIKGFLCLIWFLLVPFLVGLLFRDKLLKQKSADIGHSMLIGYLLLFALFYLLTMPLLLLKAPLRLLVLLFAILSLSLSILSVLLCRKHFRVIFGELLSRLKSFKSIKTVPWVMILAVLLILFQTGLLTFYQHIDDDDAFYVATATTAVSTDTIVEIDPFTGNELLSHRMRYVMSPYPVYTAVMSRLILTHPTITAHTVFPAIFIPLAYLVAYLLMAKFFARRREDVAYALLFFALLTLFGNVSIYTNSTFLLFRIWQGKSMLANVFIPALLLYAAEAMSQARVSRKWIIPPIAVLGGCLASSMAVALLPVLLGLLSVVYSVLHRRVTPMILSLLTLIPCIVMGIIYIRS